MANIDAFDDAYINREISAASFDGEAVRVESSVEQVRAIGRRVAMKNLGKAPWPPVGTTLREIAHEGHRH